MLRFLPVKFPLVIEQLSVKKGIEETYKTIQNSVVLW
jgi:hypothetical protein